jgi:hypothetical protein
MRSVARFRSLLGACVVAQAVYTYDTLKAALPEPSVLSLRLSHAGLPLAPTLLPETQAACTAVMLCVSGVLLVCGIRTRAAAAIGSLSLGHALLLDASLYQNHHCCSRSRWPCHVAVRGNLKAHTCTPFHTLLI